LACTQWTESLALALISGIDQLLIDGDDQAVVYVDGTGDARVFTGYNPNATQAYNLVSPAEDYGVLSNDPTSGQFIYTATDETQYTFSSAGLLLTVTNSRHETLHYSYDAAGRLTQVVAPDNGATTIDYAIGVITEPGNRTVTLTRTGDTLTSITDPGAAAADAEQLTYSGDLLTNVNWGVLSDTVRYDGNGFVSAVISGGSEYDVTSAAAQLVQLGSTGPVTAVVTEPALTSGGAARPPTSLLPPPPAHDLHARPARAHPGGR
jgi:YD repeat-containing protein